MAKVERRRLVSISLAAIKENKQKGIWAKSRAEDWAERHFHYELCKSKKWSNARLWDIMEKTHQNPMPECMLKADIKHQPVPPVPERKAPRMIITDGDGGQIMALMVIKCFEDLLFDHMEERSVKHCNKRAAIENFVKKVRQLKPGAKVVEGDGSAWDTTCNVQVRDDTENIVLHHIMKVLISKGVCPESLHEEHERINTERADLTIFFQKKFEKISLKIPPIRRSGHRGTSCLNWWVNQCMRLSSKNEKDN